MVMMRRLLLLLALAPMFALPRPRSPIRTPTLHKNIAPPLLEVACLRGGGGGVSAVEIIDALKSAAAAWFAASVVYLTTLQWSDTRQSASQRPLPDLRLALELAPIGDGESRSRSRVLLGQHHHRPGQHRRLTPSNRLRRDDGGGSIHRHASDNGNDRRSSLDGRRPLATCAWFLDSIGFACLGGLRLV